MLRCTFAARAAAVATAGAVVDNSKAAMLYKLLTGDAQFKGKAAVKECNVVHQFGENWKSEVEAYGKSLPEDKKKILQRQIARLELTRYTISELAQYAGEGPQNVNQVAKKANVAQGVAYLQAKGAEAFEKYVSVEAANAHWKPEDAKKFIDAVKAAAK